MRQPKPLVKVETLCPYGECKALCVVGVEEDEEDPRYCGKCGREGVLVYRHEPGWKIGKGWEV